MKEMTKIRKWKSQAIKTKWTQFIMNKTGDRVYIKLEKYNYKELWNKKKLQVIVYDNQSNIIFTYFCFVKQT